MERSLRQKNALGVRAAMVMLSLLGSAIPAGWAQYEGGEQISISADKNVLVPGDKVMITGTVPGLGASDKPLIRVFSPAGELVRADPINVDEDGNYSYELVLGGIANLVGDYRIVVSHGSREAETFVRLDAFPVANCENLSFSGFPSQWELSAGTSTHEIEYRTINGTVTNMSTNLERKSIIIEIDSVGNGCFIVFLPSEVILAENRNFTAFVDDRPALFREIEDGRNGTRLLYVSFDEGDSQVEIVGTWIVPEFSSSLIFILATTCLIPILLIRKKIFSAFGAF